MGGKGDVTMGASNIVYAYSTYIVLGERTGNKLWGKKFAVMSEEGGSMMLCGQ